MKGLAILGIVLLLGGLAALIWPAITVTHREKAVDIGPIEVTREDRDKTAHYGYRQITGDTRIASFAHFSKLRANVLIRSADLPCAN